MMVFDSRWLVDGRSLNNFVRCSPHEIGIELNIAIGVLFDQVTSREFMTIKISTFVHKRNNLRLVDPYAWCRDSYTQLTSQRER